jgi:protocatechuate 3,4-dioxygenase beta subunit
MAMIEFTPETITDAVIERMSTTPDPRLREIMASLVRHLHDFAREVNLTPEEWIGGIGFLTRVGHITTDVRQEFVLLSDTLGLSTLINTLHDRTAIEEATHTSLLGPFFREDTPEMKLGDSISKKDTSQQVCLWGKITNVKGEPLPNAKVIVWQTASDGSYDLQQGDGSEVDYRGIFRTDKDGKFYLRSVRAKGYYIPMDGPVGDMIRAQKREGCRPAHIHFLISAPGYRELVSALYVEGSDYLDSDEVFGAAADLVVEEKANDPGAPIKGIPSLHFDFSLSRAADVEKTGRMGADPSKVAAAQ